MDKELQKLVGQNILEITGLEQYSDEVNIVCDVLRARFMHYQECCESVNLEDFEIDGDLAGATILSAEEVSNEDAPEPDSEWIMSYTWTFYRIETTKGGLFMRWFGESNGYYSEGVDVDFFAA